MHGRSEGAREGRGEEEGGIVDLSCVMCRVVSIIMRPSMRWVGIREGGKGGGREELLEV